MTTKNKISFRLEGDDDQAHKLHLTRHNTKRLVAVKLPKGVEGTISALVFRYKVLSYVITGVLFTTINDTITFTQAPSINLKEHLCYFESNNKHYLRESI